MNERTRVFGRRVARARTAALLALAVSVAGASPVFADPPPKQTFFVCPSVSTNNARGMWVIGTHGGYYVLIPQKGNNGGKVFLTVPAQVASLAQIPAGWALYNALPSYPNFVGMAMLLQEGIDVWLGSPAGWEEGDPANVMDNGDGTYTVTNLRLFQSLTIDHPVPLASAAIW